MSETLYDVLGVRPGDGAEVIRKAYRKKAHSLHPDRGGDAEAFKRVQQAYDVLADEERRKRYDETGDEGESGIIDVTLREALAILSQVLSKIVVDLCSSKINPATRDIKKQAIQEINGEADKAKNLITVLCKAKIWTEDVAKRFTTTGQNFCREILDANFRTACKQLEVEEAKLASCNKAIEILEHTDYALDCSQSETMDVTQSGIYTTIRLSDMWTAKTKGSSTQ